MDDVDVDDVDAETNASGAQREAEDVIYACLFLFAIGLDFCKPK